MERFCELYQKVLNSTKRKMNIRENVVYLTSYFYFNDHIKSYEWCIIFKSPNHFIDIQTAAWTWQSTLISVNPSSLEKTTSYLHPPNVRGILGLSTTNSWYKNPDKMILQIIAYSWHHHIRRGILGLSTTNSWYKNPDKMISQIITYSWHHLIRVETNDLVVFL